jgi:EAL domain-containing protein (putative c-di-GMP-specific phosphodiesterase class I)
VTSDREHSDRTLARLGGDEFTILLEDMTSPADAELVAGRVLAALAPPIDCDGHEVFANASVGVVHGTGDYADARDLLRDADVAMYRAKTAGRGRFAVFDATMHTEAVARLQLEGDLRRAVERHEMALVYQPVVSLRTGAVAGVEALVRWCRPDGTVVNPADFIPVAEDTGLIVPLGTWVMQEACRQMRAWRDAHPGVFEEMTVAVNVSARQLTDADALLQVVRDTLAAHNLPASAVKIEITEGVMMEPGAATGILARLRSAGIALHMDDFGTGYSSLSRLHCFPIQGLKIDRAFISQSAMGQTSIALLQSIVALSHHLGIQVVAEGVESAEQVVLLQALECDYAQGYHFAKPLPADQVPACCAGPKTWASSAAAAA